MITLLVSLLLLAKSTATTDAICNRPGTGCVGPYDVYSNIDCDGDGVLDHVCTTTNSLARYVALSSSGDCSSWVQDNTGSCVNCDETLYGDKGADYRGCQSKTELGFTCQRWDSQTPYSHSFQASVDRGGHHNYCRNPDGGDSIWCYTTDASKKWDYCKPKAEVWVYHETTNCDGGSARPRADFTGSVETCKEMCSALDTCGGFIRVDSNGRCYFRGAPTIQYKAQIGRNCYEKRKVAPAIIGTDDEDKMLGGEGDDSMFGGEGEDYMHGGPDADVLHGGTGRDKFHGDGEGEDFFYVEGNYNKITINDGLGNKIFVNDNSKWTEFNGSTQKEYMRGNGGLDYAYGGDGNDQMYGNKGEDKMYGNEGEDKMDGGPDADKFYTSSTDGDKIYVDGELLDLSASSGGPTEGDDIIHALDGMDKIYAGDGWDIIYGGEGKDKLFGGPDDDTFYSGSDDGYDTWHIKGPSNKIHMTGNGEYNYVKGSNYDEKFYGMDGADKMVGGDGADKFYTYSHDGDKIYVDGNLLDLSVETIPKSEVDAMLECWRSGKSADAWDAVKKICKDEEPAAGDCGDVSKLDAKLQKMRIEVEELKTGQTDIKALLNAVPAPPPGCSSGADICSVAADVEFIKSLLVTLEGKLATHVMTPMPTPEPTRRPTSKFVAGDGWYKKYCAAWGTRVFGKRMAELKDMTMEGCMNACKDEVLCEAWEFNKANGDCTRVKTAKGKRTEIQGGFSLKYISGTNGCHIIEDGCYTENANVCHICNPEPCPKVHEPERELPNPLDLLR